MVGGAGIDVPTGAGVRLGVRFMDLSVFFAGTGGSVPTARRGLPAILVRRGGDRILFDCGEGTQRQLLSSVGLMDLTEVFLTHFHADHWLGLPGLLKTFDLRDRERPLTVYGPPGLRALLTGALRLAGRVRYELAMVEVQPGDEVPRDGYRIAPVAASHRGPALAYVVYEDERPGEFDPALAERLGLEPGPEFGRVQRGETVRGVSPEQVMGPSRPGRKLVLSGDTRPCDAIRIAAHRADLLVHEATFAAGGGRSRDRERPLDRPGGGDDRAGRRGDDAGAEPHLDPPSAERDPRRGTRAV